MNFVYVPATNGTNANAGFMVSDWMEDAAAERGRVRVGEERDGGGTQLHVNGFGYCISWWQISYLHLLGIFPFL